MASTLDDAVRIIRAGGVLVYPTETLYAVGGSGLSREAAARVMTIKGRPEGKPLPLIIGEMSQLGLVTDLDSDDIRRLASLFWPGPLSVLVPARAALAPQVSDFGGLTSVRLSAHPLARRLCLESGSPLIATSANPSGRPAAARPDELDAGLLGLADLAILDKPWPAGGLPSTVVSMQGHGALQVIRDGAIGRASLTAAGFAVA